MDNKKNRSFRHGALLLALAMLPALPCHADLTADKIADLSFGTIDFTATTAVGNITIGSNGNVTYGSTTSGSGVGTPGQVALDAPEGTTVSIACTPGTLAMGASLIPIDPVNFVVGTASIGGYGAGTECAGPATTVATHTITATPSENVIFIGGQLAIHGTTLQNGTYRGTNSGGSQPAFLIVVQ